MHSIYIEREFIQPFNGQLQEVAQSNTKKMTVLHRPNLTKCHKLLVLLL